jgi:hypothetical protein
MSFNSPFLLNDRIGVLLRIKDPINGVPPFGLRLLLIILSAFHLLENLSKAIASKPHLIIDNINGFFLKRIACTSNPQNAIQLLLIIMLE